MLKAVNSLINAAVTTFVTVILLTIFYIMVIINQLYAYACMGYTLVKKHYFPHPLKKKPRRN